MKKLKFLSLALVTGLIFTSCSGDDDLPEEVNEEELITTVTITLSPEGEGTVVTLQSRDLDGDGPNPPIISVSGNLAANTSYAGEIVLLNESISPPEDITEEVKEEADEHQFFYVKGGGLEVDITYEDQDQNENPLGASFTLITGTESTGTLNVILRHMPKKPNNGTLADAGGETDINTTFNVTVE